MNKEQKPIGRMVYYCPFCIHELNSFRSEIREMVEDHMGACNYNPKNKHCVTCLHNEYTQEVLKEEHQSERPCYNMPLDCSNGSRWEEAKGEYFKEV